MPPTAQSAALAANGGLHLSGTRVRSFAQECKRKWAFEYIGGIVPPASEGQLLGTMLHWVAENWLRHGLLPSLVGLPPGVTGKDAEKRLARAREVFAAGVAYLPTPKSPGLYVEEPFALPLRSGGVFTGTLDLLDATDPTDPELGDHKSTKAFQWAKTPAQLRVDPQAVSYAKPVMAKFGLKSLRAKWLYYRTSGAAVVLPVKYTLTHDDVSRGWERIEHASEAMLELHAKRVEPTNVEPTGYPEVCNKYGKGGCYFKALCLDANGRPKNMTERTHMGLFDDLRIKHAEPGGAPSVPPAANDDDDIFGGTSPFAGADSVAVNPPPRMTAPAPASSDALGIMQAALGIPKNPMSSAAGGGVSQATKALETSGGDKVTETQATPTKRTRKPKSTAPEKGPETSGPSPAEISEGWSNALTPVESELAVFVDAVPLKGKYAGVKPLRVADIAGPAMAKAAQLQGVANWRLIDFGKGDGVLAACFSEWLDEQEKAGTPLRGIVVLDGYQPETKALALVLEERADLFVRKLG